MLLWALLTCPALTALCRTSANFWRNTIDLQPRDPLLSLEGVHAYTFRGTEVIGKFHASRRRQTALREIAFLRGLRGLGSVVQFRFCVSDRRYTAIFTERLRADLNAGLSAFQRLTLPRQLQLLLGPTRALAALHRTGFINGDLKPHNVMIAADGRGLKLIDFDCSARWGKGVRGYTRFYAAPEVAAASRGFHANGAQDAWSWAVTVAELLVPHLRRKLKALGGSFPPRALQPAHVTVVRRELNRLTRRKGSQLRVLAKCLQHDPAERPTLEEIAITLHRTIRALASKNSQISHFSEEKF